MGNITLEEINLAYALHEKWQRQYYADAQQVKDFKTALETIKAHKIIEGEIVGKNETEREARAGDLLSKEYDELERAERDEWSSKLEVLVSGLDLARIDKVIRLLELANNQHAGRV